MRRGRRICVASFVLVTAVGLAGLTDGSPAGAAQNFRGLASADAVRVMVTVPNFPVTSSVVDTSLYATQAVVTSNNSSQAFASSPYPGEGVVTLPGTLAGFNVPGVPEYPLYASSVHPDRQHAQVGDGPFKLVSDSTEKSSEASASSGVAGDQNIGAAASKASVKRDDAGGVVAASESKVDAFKAQALRIGSVVSTATTKLSPDGQLERASSLEVSGVTVNDVSVALTKDGIVVGGQTLPLDAKAINEALAKARLKVTYIEPQELPNGVVGAGVKITTGVEVPGSGVTDVSWTLGRSMAVIDSAGAGDDVLSDLPSDDTIAPPPAPQGESPAPAAGTGSAPAAAFDSAAALSIPTGTATSKSTGSGSSTSAGYSSSASSTSASPATESPAAAPTESAAAPASPVPFTPATEPASSKQVDSSAFFLLLVAGAAGVVVLSQVLSLLGVKVR
jgi:hypothetical protein